MNTKALSRAYDCLTPRERYPLVVAARLRGDAAEVERLLRSAPAGRFAVPHHFGLAAAVSDLTLLHLAQQLDAAAWLWRLSGALEGIDLVGQGRSRGDAEERLSTLLGVWAYRLVVGREAWRRLCAELHLDPDAVLRDLPGAATAADAEAMAERWALGPAEAAAAVRARRGAGATVVTAEALLADYRAGLAAREGEWK